MTECKTPPAGWTCSRGVGHDGPCAASPQPLTVEDLLHIANLPGGANDQLRAAMSERESVQQPAGQPAAVTDAMVEAGAKVLDPDAFEVPLRGYGEGAAAQARESAIQAAREVLEAAEAAR